MGATFDTKIVEEKGVAIVQVVFKDEDDNSVIPNVSTIKWTLTNRPTLIDTAPTIINSREQVSISSASTINIVLEGADLAMLTGEEDEKFVWRVLTLEYQYNSTVQNSLDTKAQHLFRVENLHYIT
jgi:hypothetical protein